MTTPPPSLADRAEPDAVAVAARLFAGDFSPATFEAFGRHVGPFYAAPGHLDVPARLLALSSFQADVASHFFGVLAPAYDVRAQLGEIVAPTLVLVGRYDWVCPPAASHPIADGIAGAELVELADAGHFAFAEEPARFQGAVRTFLSQLDPIPSQPPASALRRSKGQSSATQRAMPARHARRREGWSVSKPWAGYCREHAEPGVKGTWVSG